MCPQNTQLSLQRVSKVRVFMAQPSFILLTKTIVSLASISFPVLPSQMNNLTARNNDCEHQCPQTHRMAQSVLGCITLEVDEGT